MTVRLSETFLKWSLRLSPWKQPRFPVTASTNKGSFGIYAYRLNGSEKLYFCAGRFYSESGINSEDLQESNGLHSELFPPVGIQRKSAFTEQLHQCSSPSDVLDLTCKYSPTVRQVSTCLTHMWFSMKKMSDEQRRCEFRLMFEHPGFDKLLVRAMGSVQHMRNNDIAYSLLSIVNLGVPQRSRVVQTFLRVCQEKLNEFDEKTLSILASSLENMEDTPNVVALKEGMRLVVEARLPGIKNVMALQIMMRILGRDAPKELKHKLEKRALSLTEQFSLPNAQHMISTMAAMGFYSKPLLNVCSKKITENLHGIPFNRLYNVLQSCKELLYRDTDMLTGISDHVASTSYIWTNKQLLMLLSAFEDLLFCPTALMEVFAERVINNPNALTLKDLLCALKVYSHLNYDLQHQRKQFLDSLCEALGSYLPKMSATDLLKAAYCLCLMNRFPPALLEQLLQSRVLEELKAGKFPQTQERMLQTLDTCLRLDQPPLPRRLVIPAGVLGNPAPVSPSVDLRLSRSLQSLVAARADAVLQEAVVVENVYTIDGVITQRVPMQCHAAGSSSCAGVPPSAESSGRIAVIYAPQSSFSFGSSNIRGALSLKIRHLRLLGYTPVLVTEQQLQCASEEERTDILRGLIFLDKPPEVEHLGA